MAASIVNSGKFTAGSVTSPQTTAAIGWTPTQYNEIYCWLRLGGNASAAAAAITANFAAGVAMTALGSYLADGGAGTSHGRWFKCVVIHDNIVAPTFTISWTGGASTYDLIVVEVFAGGGAIIASASGTGTAPISASVSPSTTIGNLLLCGFASVTTAQTYSAALDNAGGSSMTLTQPSAGTFRSAVTSLHEAVGTYAPRATQSTSEGWLATALSIPDRVARRIITTDTVAGANRTNTTINKDSLIANGDILVVNLHVEAGGIAVTPPTGWTEITGSPMSTTATSDCHVYVKIASSEPASWTWTHSLAFTGLALGAYQFASQTLSDLIFPANGITSTKTIVNNTGLSVVCANFTINRDGAMLIGITDTVNGAALSDHHGFLTNSCWSGTNGAEVDDLAGPGTGVLGDGTPWVAGDSSGASFGSRTFTFSANDFLSGATFSLQPPAVGGVTDASISRSGARAQDAATKAVSSAQVSTSGARALDAATKAITSASVAASTGARALDVATKATSGGVVSTSGARAQDVAARATSVGAVSTTGARAQDVTVKGVSVGAVSTCGARSQNVAVKSVASAVVDRSGNRAQASEGGIAVDASISSTGSRAQNVGIKAISVGVADTTGARAQTVDVGARSAANAARTGGRGITQSSGAIIIVDASVSSTGARAQNVGVKSIVTPVQSRSGCRAITIGVGGRIGSGVGRAGTRSSTLAPPVPIPVVVVQNNQDCEADWALATTVTWGSGTARPECTGVLNNWSI